MSRVTVLFLLTLAARSVNAQSVAGLGAISGTVHDASGASIAGAQVVISNETNGVRRTLTTNEAGVFTAPSLQPAAGYTVTITKPGFATYTAKDIQVAVGRDVNLDVTLSIATGSTQIDVTADPPVVDSTRTDVSQIVNERQIQDLPINGRRVDSFVLLAPAVVPDGTFGLLSFRGIAGGNNFLTDGNDTTQTYYNENAGRTRIQSQIAQDAVQEFQVVSDNFSAEFGQAMGGVVNTVTRSGSNTLHGTAYWFFRNQDFNARDPFATINPQETRHQFGASIGGDIVKDKLFYFFNYEGVRRDFPLLASITAPGNPLFSTTGQLLPNVCGAPATPEQCQAAVAFLGRQFQTVPRTVNQNLGFGKIDWRPSERHAFSVSMNLLRWISPNGLQTQAVLNNANGVGNNVNSSVRDKYGRFTWTYVVSPQAVNEFRFGWFHDLQFDYPNPALAIPGIGFLGINITGQTNLGTATDYPRKNPSENRYEFADTLTWTKGKHTVKVGFDIERTEDFTDLLFNRTGTYLFPTFSALAADLTGNTAGNKDWSTYTQTIGNPVVDFYVSNYAVFAQDYYKITPRLTLNLGVRYDYTDLPQPPRSNSDYPATGRIPTYSKEVAPRVGIAYALDQQSNTVVRAGYGIFYGRYPGGLINTLILGNGLIQQSITLNSSTASDRAAGPVFPNTLPSGGSYSPPVGSVSLNLASSNFRSPYTEQWTAAVERAIGKSVSLTVSYIGSRGARLTSVTDVNIGAPGPVVTYRINDASGNQVGSYATPVYVRQNRVDPRYARVNVVGAALKSWYNGLAVQLNKRLSREFTGSLAYTWSHAIDQGQGNAGTPNIFASGGPQSYQPDNFSADKGSSALDVRHRLVVNGVWQPTLSHGTGALSRYAINGWQLSILGTFQSSPPATPTVQISSAPVPAPFSAAFTGSLNGYTGSGFGTRVPFLPISSLNIGDIERVDARIAKRFAITDRYEGMFTFDAFNVFNHTYCTSVATRAYTAAVVAGIPTLNPAAGFGACTATQGFPDGTNARRLQLGVRFAW